MLLRIFNYHWLYVFSFMSVSVLAQESFTIVTVKSEMEDKPYVVDFNEINNLKEFNVNAKFNASSAIIQDDERRISFYTNGCDIYNRLHERLTSTSLQQNYDTDEYCSQKGLLLKNAIAFLPVEEGSSKYYTLYLTGTKGTSMAFENSSLQYCILDTSFHTVSEPTILLKGNLSFFTTTPKGKNTDEHWIALYDRLTNEVKILELESSGIHEKISLFVPTIFNLDQCNLDINILFSPDGSKLVIHNSSCYMIMYDFDPCNGKLVGPRLNLSGGQTTTSGSDFMFTHDSEYLIVGQEISSTNVPSFNQIAIFKTDRIGSNINPDMILSTPFNYSLGHFVTISNNKFFLFNKLSDRYYLELDIDSNNIKNSKSKVLRLPYKYLPFSTRTTRLDYFQPVDCTSEVNILNRLSINIFPNPSTDKITFQSDLNGSAFIFEISALDGKIISKGIATANYSIDVSDLLSGQYALTITSLDNTPLISQLITIVRP